MTRYDIAHFGTEISMCYIHFTPELDTSIPLNLDMNTDANWGFQSVIKN